MSAGAERTRDLQRLDAAIARIESLMGEDVNTVVVLQACDRLVKLLERRSALLGLDQKPASSPEAGESVLDAMRRELADGARGKASS